MIIAQSAPVTIENWSEILPQITDIALKLDRLYEYQVYGMHGVWLAAGLLFGFAVLWVHGR